MSGASRNHKRARLANESEDDELDAMQDQFRQEQIAFLADEVLKSLPVFLVQHKLGYDHSYRFSLDGHGFQLAIEDLPDHLAQVAYEFATSIHPSHAREFHGSILNARGRFALQLMLGTEEKVEEQYTISSLAERTKNPDCQKYYEYVQGLVFLRHATISDTSHDTSFATNLITRQERQSIYANPICDQFTIVDSVNALTEFNEMLRRTTCKEGRPDYFFSYIEPSNYGPRRNQPAWLVLFVRSQKHTWLLNLRKLGRNITSHKYGSVTVARVLGDPEVNKAVLNAKPFAKGLNDHFDISPCKLFDVRIMQKKAQGQARSVNDTILFANRELANVMGLSWIESARCWFMNGRYAAKDFYAPTVSPGALHMLAYKTRNISRLWTIHNAGLGILDELAVYEESENAVDSALSTSGFQFNKRRTKNSSGNLMNAGYF